MSEPGFQRFLEILRSGDPEAVDRLLADFDPFLRRAIRLRLFDGRVRSVVDTADILQSLLKDFLERNETDGAATSSRKPHAYLAAAAQYKIAGKVRKERRRTADLSDVAEPMSPQSSPGAEVDNRDMIDAIRIRLDEASRRILDLSQQGRTWRQIADEVDGHPDSLRIALRRSIAAALATIRDAESSHAG